MTRDTSDPARPKLYFGRFGWLLTAAFVLVMGGVFLQLAPQISKSRATPPPPFDLTGALIPVDQIVNAGFSRDGIRALDHPLLLTASQIDSLAQIRRKKYLVSGERVIGVAVGNAARAYPISVLNWHEVVNDTLGGVPIAVCFHPLCDAVTVFDRRFGGEALTFGLSGLLYNSHHLLYDRRPGENGESLWSPVQRRAVAGPAAKRGESIDLRGPLLCSWGEWRTRYPETTVIRRDPIRMKLYKRKPYNSYYGSELLKFPVRPLPPPDRLPLKSRVIVLFPEGEPAPFSVPAIVRKMGDAGFWETTVDGRPIRFESAGCDDCIAARFTDSDRPVPALYSFWFAWYSLNPDDDLISID